MTRRTELLDSAATDARIAAHAIGAALDLSDAEAVMLFAKASALATVGLLKVELARELDAD